MRCLLLLEPGAVLELQLVRVFGHRANDLGREAIRARRPNRLGKSLSLYGACYTPRRDEVLDDRLVLMSIETHEFYAF